MPWFWSSLSSIEHWSRESCITVQLVGKMGIHVYVIFINSIALRIREMFYSVHLSVYVCQRYPSWTATQYTQHSESGGPWPSSFYLWGQQGVCVVYLPLVMNSLGRLKYYDWSITNPWPKQTYHTFIIRYVECLCQAEWSPRCPLNTKIQAQS